MKRQVSGDHFLTKGVNMDDNTIWKSYTYVRPTNDLFYKTIITVDGYRLTLTFGYNSRINKRYVSVETSVTTVLLPRTFLDVDRTCWFDSNADVIGLGRCFVTLQKIDSGKPDDILNWADNYQIVFRNVSSETQLDYDKTFRDFIYLGG